MNFKIASALLIFFGLNLAHAQIVTCTPDKSQCTVEGMPYLSQKEKSVVDKFGLVACVPTSISMMLEGIFSVKKDVVPGSINARAYAQNPYQEIATIAYDMPITKNGTGTKTEIAEFKKLASGFKAKMNFITYTTVERDLSPSTIHAESKLGTVQMMIIGKYTPSCTTLASGRKSCSFARHSGHGLAIKTTSNSNIFVNDPYWYGYLVTNTHVADLSVYKGATLSFPSIFNGGRARALFSQPAGQPIPILERIYGLR